MLQPNPWLGLRQTLIPAVSLWPTVPTPWSRALMTCPWTRTPFQLSEEGQLSRRSQRSKSFKHEKFVIRWSLMRSIIWLEWTAKNKNWSDSFSNIRLRKLRLSTCSNLKVVNLSWPCQMISLLTYQRSGRISSRHCMSHALWETRALSIIWFLRNTSTLISKGAKSGYHSRLRAGTVTLG